MQMAVPVPARTEHPQVESAIQRVRAAAGAWAILPISEKIALARACKEGIGRNAERMVITSCEGKRVPATGSSGGEEWFTTPLAVARLLSKLIASLKALQRGANTPVVGVRWTEQGRLAANILPLTDPFTLNGIRAEVHLQEGVSESEFDASRASFYKRPHQGRVCAVLGAGNINAIPMNDVLTKLFVEGKVCVLKMSPVNAYLGPIIEDAFRDLVAQGYLAIVYGGGDVGKLLVNHPLVDEVHLTGGQRTHDAIVWGPPGPEADARRKRNEPLLKKPMTSELGCVTPILLAPGAFEPNELRYQAQHVAGMFTVNSAVNCATPRLLITARGWSQRDQFLELVAKSMQLIRSPTPWYPGTTEAFANAIDGRPVLHQVPRDGDRLPWTIVGLDAGGEDSFFASEYFCPVLGVVEVGTTDPLEFLDAAVRFANDRLFGTLSANLIVRGRALDDDAIQRAVETAIHRLQYGLIGLNAFCAYAFVLGTGVWGAYPGSTAQDIQSGIGFVHNALMIERAEKTVIRHPFTTPWKQAVFPSHRRREQLGRAMVATDLKGPIHLAQVIPALLGG